MNLLPQLRSHAGKLFIFFCVIALLSFYHLVGLPSKTLNPVTDGHVSSPDVGSQGPTSDYKHPIELLVDEARRKYLHMIEGQSKSLEQAIANYKKRYSREPPPGFDDWYHVAVQLNATIIDNYDTIMATFEPYWYVFSESMFPLLSLIMSPETCLEVFILHTCSKARYTSSKKARLTPKLQPGVYRRGSCREDDRYSCQRSSIFDCQRENCSKPYATLER